MGVCSKSTRRSIDLIHSKINIQCSNVFAISRQVRSIFIFCEFEWFAASVDLVCGGKIVAHFFAFVWIHLIPIGNVDAVAKYGAVYLFNDDRSAAMRAFNNYIHFYNNDYNFLSSVKWLYHDSGNFMFCSSVGFRYFQFQLVFRWSRTADRNNRLHCG